MHVDSRCLRLVLLATLVACASAAHAQVFSNKEGGRKNQAIVDSLKKADYPYALPIWGDKATKRGYTLPYSAGVSLQYFGQESDIVINNLQVGFNGGPLYDLDGLVKFDRTISRSDGISLRPDIWLFPFLNVYAILGRSAASTEVEYGLWVPDSSGAEVNVFSASTKVDFTANTFGIGFTPTLGVRGGWMALDMNVTWTDVPQLDQPAMAFVFDPRIGKAFRLGRQDENINVWVGGFRLKINTGTSGSIPLSDALPLDQWQTKVDSGLKEIERLSAEIEAWWNSLSPPQQENPVNIARYNAAKQALETAGGVLNRADTAIASFATGSVQYSLDKKPEDMWNFMVGGQYQLSRNWMFRAEVGFLTSRTHVITGVQYRFGL
jgi:hypothetical protein